MDTTLENTKLIAEFMGYIDNGCSEEGFLIHPDTNIDVDIPELQYDTSWDWLMPVVEKIESIHRCEVIFSKFVIEIYMGNIRKSYCKIGTSKIQAVFTACVLFIEWYNKQNQEVTND